MQQQELLDTLMDMVPAMVAMTFTMQLANSLYRENPHMFWSYMYQKNKHFIYNCRM
jgi:hypothetical protein